jgi:sporulation protein YlmC with PRC-barrel domain
LPGRGAPDCHDPVAESPASLARASDTHERLNTPRRHRRSRPIPMRKFLTELRGKTVMTNDGQILGMIDNFVVDTVTGGIAHVLVTPSEDVEQRLFQSDASGRLVLPFKSMRAVKDVVVMEIGK